MKKHILIVDDSAVMRVLLSEVLYGEYDVSTAADGVEALERLLKGVPVDAIVLDLNMPRMGGAVLLGRIRQMAAFAQVPVIVVSAHFESRERIAALDAGASDFLTKPFNPLELRLRLRRLLLEQLRQPATRVPARTGLAKVIHLVRARAAAV